MNTKERLIRLLKKSVKKFNWYRKLTGCNIDLSYANLSYTDLTGANLSNIDLRYANLSGAKLIRVDLTNADLRYADLFDAILPKKTLFIINFYSILIHRRYIKIDCEQHTISEWKNFTNKEILKMDYKRGLNWWKKNKNWLINLAKQIEN